MLDLLLKNTRINNGGDLLDISVRDGKTESIESPYEIHTVSSQGDQASVIYDATGHWVCSGFYESHIHLDKACILDRCSIEKGTLDEAVEETRNAKNNFTEQDVFDRASRKRASPKKRKPKNCYGKHLKTVPI